MAFRLALAPVTAFTLLLAACGNDSGTPAQQEEQPAATGEPVSAAGPEAEEPAPSRPEPDSMPADLRGGCGAVTATGYCGVTFGMSAAEAQAAYPGGLVSTLDENDPDMGACYYLNVAPDSYDIGFMAVDGTVLRLDVRAPGFETAAGASVGMTTDEVLALYPQAELQPNPYTDDNDIHVPLEGGAKVIFELEFEGDTIGRYRIGLPPAVDYIEGCA